MRDSGTLCKPCTASLTHAVPIAGRARRIGGQRAGRPPLGAFSAVAIQDDGGSHRERRTQLLRSAPL